MPLLRFTTAIDATETEWRTFVRRVAELYAETMNTETSHVAVERNRHTRDELWLGRGEPGGMVFLDADIRKGRSHEQRRAFAVAVMDDLADRWGVPTPNMKVVFTEHQGQLMMGYDRVGDDWSPRGSEDTDRS